MSRINTLYILSDQFAKQALKCYGNTDTHTPNIDALAEQGTVFTNAITNSPLCCPARASLATGKYVHEIRAWDNAFVYSGQEKSWMHKLRESGMTMDAIGKLHFRSNEDDNGFTHEINSMNVVEGFGDVAGCLRNECNLFDKRKGVLNAGPGESSYTRYDAENSHLVSDWIREQAENTADTPWAMFWGIALPHPPNKILKKYFEYYEQLDFALPPLWRKQDWNNHPATAYIRKYFNFEQPFDEKEVRNFLIAYYGACSYVDDLIGESIKALKDSGQFENTRIIFTADHGEARGTRGIFGKFSLYEESIGIPLIMKGPDIPRNLRVETPVSLVDFYPTMCEWYEIPYDNEQISGTSMSSFFEYPTQDRTVFSEYHGVGTQSAMYCMRTRDYKYIYHVGKQAELYALDKDPLEVNNLQGVDAYERIEKKLKAELMELVSDPEAIDAQAKKDQKNRIDEAGGYAAVLERGTFDNTPPPGVDAVFFSRK